MKNLILAAAVFVNSIAFSQNTFPSSGNVGIGTTSPQDALSLTSSSSTWVSFNKVGAWETGFQFKKSGNVAKLAGHRSLSSTAIYAPKLSQAQIIRRLTGI